jgi:hypothetical protein
MPTVIRGTDNSASAPALTGSDSDTGIFFPAADTIAFAEGGTEVMRINSSGNVGIGTSSPASKLNLSNGDFRITGPGGGGSETTYGDVIFAASSYPNSGAAIRGYNTYGDNGGLIFQTSFGGNRTERARIDSSGSLIVGATSANFSPKFAVTSGAADNTTAQVAGNYTVFHVVNSSNTSYTPMKFWNNGVAGTVGTISCTTSATTYATSSDYRLKENVQPMTGALSVVAQLKPCTYTWKTDGVSTQGFIAHELQSVVPECVVGEKDAVDADGNPVYQGIDTSFLVATLTAAIQEQQAIITALTARVAALEAANAQPE